ncbi:hypothetical protein Tco_1154695 [Tanacetum coccineum]
MKVKPAHLCYEFHFILNPLQIFQIILVNIVPLSQHLGAVLKLREFQGHVPPLQRVVLDIFPQLRPPNHLPSLWTVFLQKLLHYLPNSDSSVHNEGDAAKPVESRESNGTSSNNQLEVESSSSSSDSKKTSGGEPKIIFFSDLFAEKLLPVLVDLFLQAPLAENLIIFPYVIQGLGRCSITRRENPRSDLSTYRPARIRFWKEVADVYEIFLVGYCGGPFILIHWPQYHSYYLLFSVAREDPEIMQRLIITLDRCASRTCSLPVETVELVPPHTTSTTLTARLPIAFVLQEMARVTMHPETASVLPLHPFLKGGLLEENTGLRAHLFVLFSPLCELVKSRNSRVRDLVQALLRLVSTELGLHKICLTN